ncbi:MAG: aminomethyl-transferring glycine dehydrogenase subunit GcvPB [Magnetospirillum sp. WYHS-4]
MPGTLTGNRGLQMEEPLIFEQGHEGRTGVDLPEPPAIADRLGGKARKAPVGLPGLSEPQAVRHYTRLSQKNYAIDAGFYPLGSCTMKHNPRMGEKLARLPGLAQLHPLQPQSTVQGALELLETGARWLAAIVGLPGLCLSPAAGAHGELAGLMTIRAAQEARGDARRRVLVPESAHGTNPSSAHLCGYGIQSIPANARGRVDLAALKAELDEGVAAIMVTNPNTCGLFEDEILEIAAATHGAGAFFYCDGANMNAIVGKVRPGDLGVDCMHLNLHKTFSTPHGGGGPGAGPVALSAELAPFAPLPHVVRQADGSYRLIERAEDAAGAPLGRVKGFHGQFGVIVRALAYMMSMGGDGLKQVAEDAVLNANYLLALLKDDLSPSFAGPCMHEALFDDRFLKDTGVSTLDFAKALIDEGFHPMTMYFPLVVHGALLMEPTETETKEGIDQFAGVVKELARRARKGETQAFKDSPRLAPRRRLDEIAAARNPVLRWREAAG